MADLGLSVLVSRTLLGLAALEVNDHSNYRVAKLLGTAVPWDRNTVSSVFIDGDFTASRRRPNVAEQFVLEVFGGSTAELHTNLGAAIDAFNQDSYTVTVTVNSVAHAYACESADAQVMWDGPREIAFQTQLQLTVPRQPVQLSGAY